MDVGDANSAVGRARVAGPGRPHPPKRSPDRLRGHTNPEGFHYIFRTLQSHRAQARRRKPLTEARPLRAVGLMSGQTIRHEPQAGKTWQLGDGQHMADCLARVVVNNFRQNDMAHGGQGAPFAPAYHRALVQSCAISEPVAVLNIGGVSNVSLIDGELLYACDCGPGNALIDDWVSSRCAVPYDQGGRIARAGRIDELALAQLLDHPYFKQVGPKSLDRNAFSAAPASGLSPEDGAATLAAFTAAAIALEARRLPSMPREWVVVGGRRLNTYLLDELRQRLAVPVRVAEDIGWNGAAIEAQAFAYLAVRSLRQLPLSWPSTTGVSRPVTGGVRLNPARTGAAAK